MEQTMLGVTMPDRTTHNNAQAVLERTARAAAIPLVTLGRGRDWKG